MNQKGQGLVEYLILVCLLAISTIAIVSVVGQNIRARYANISNALHGKKGTHKLELPSEEQFRMRGFDDFENGAFKQGDQ